MELLFSLVVILLAILFIYWRWRTVGVHDIALWFVASSIALINTGFIVRAFETGGGVGGWAYTGVLVVSGGLAVFMIGVVLGSALRAQRTEDRADQPVPVVEIGVARKRLLILAIATFVPSWLYFILLGYVPLFQGVGAVVNDGLGGLGELQSSRLSRDGYASVNGVLIPGQGLMQMVRNVGVPATAAAAIAQLRIYGWSPYRGVTLILSCVTVLLAGQRWPLIYLCVAMLAGLSLAGGRIAFRYILQIALFVALVGVALSLLQRRTLETFDAWGEAVAFAISNLLERIFFEQSIVPILSYETGAFPAGSLQGRSYYDSLVAYLPGPGASFPVEFYQTVTRSGFAYTAAPDFFTESYINFGITGLLIIPFVWGLVLTRLSSLLVIRDRALNAGVVAGLTAILAQSCFTGPVFTIGGVAVTLAAGWIVATVAPTRVVNRPAPRALGLVRYG